LGVIASLDSATRTAFLTFVAFLMIDKGLPTLWAGAAVMVTLFGGMLGKFACGIVNERLGAVKTIAITEIATALGIGLVIILPGYLAFIALPFIGVVLNGTSSVTYASVSELVDDAKHARAFGLIYTIGSMCGVISPLLFGAIADRAGLQNAFMLMALLVCLTLPLLPLLTTLARNHRLRTN
jgi:MFS family permease